MILLVPKSSHSPLAGAAAPANVSRSLPATPVREPKIWGKRKPWTSRFFFLLFFPVIFPWGTRFALLRGFPQKFSVILDWFFCQKRGYSISYPPNLADQTSKKIVSFSFLGTPVSVSEQGVPFLFLWDKKLYINGEDGFSFLFRVGGSGWTKDDGESYLEVEIL